MGTEKRERQKAGRSTRLDQAREEAARSARRKRYATIGAVVAVVVVLVALTAVLGGDDKDEKVSSKKGATTTTEAPAADGAAVLTGSDGALTAKCSFCVIQTEDAGVPFVFAAGQYRDELAPTEAGLRFRSKVAVLDNSRILTSMPVPL